MDHEEVKPPSGGHNEAASTFGRDDCETNEDDLSEDSSSSSSTLSDEPPVKPGRATQNALKLSRKERKKAEMLQLALQAITTFKASKKRSSTKTRTADLSKKSLKQNKLDQNKKRAHSGDDSDEKEPAKKESADLMRNKHLSKRLTTQDPTAFVHPLLRQILTPIRPSPPKKDLSLLPLPTPVDTLQFGPDLSYYEEGSSDDDYDPNDLLGESAFKCQMCLQVFSSQIEADEHMREQQHLTALRLMMLTLVNYCNDIDLIVRLREKIKSRKNRSETDQRRQKFPDSVSSRPGRTNSESEDEKELQQLEDSYALAGLAASDTSVSQSLLDADPAETSPVVKNEKKKRRRKRRPAAGNT